MKRILLVDTSWMMHKNKHALKMLTATIPQPSGTTITIPTGHVYGTVQDIIHLSQAFDLVIMAVDSPSKHRKEVLPEYKAGRHTPTGDPLMDYNIYNDLANILTICTALPNVHYIKVPELENDDIIASWIADSNTNPKYIPTDNGCPARELTVLHNDNDILQTRGNYYWSNSATGAVQDRRDYIFNKYQIPLDYLPLWYKVIKGDSSDKIPIAIPRFPTKNLIELCTAMADDWDFDHFIHKLESYGKGISPTWFTRLEGVSNPDNELYKALKLNYEVVKPIIRPVTDFSYKKLPYDREQLSHLLNYYQFTSEQFWNLTKL